MRKILSIALTEYRQVVWTKSFIISLLFPLVIYGGMFLLSAFFQDKTDVKDRVVIVLDRSGELFNELEASANERNRGDAVFSGDKQISPKFIFEEADSSFLEGSDKVAMVEFSNAIRDDEAFAFIIIGSGYLPAETGDGDFLHYYSDSPTYQRLPDWISRNVREIVEEKRFLESGLDQREVQKLTSHNRMERYRLAEVDAEGNIVEPEEENQIAAFIIPFGIIMLIFISINMTTPVLLNSVIEEKMQRIAEVLISSVTPLQLLAGKLFGGVGIGLTFSAVYLATLSLSLRYFEKASWVPQGTYIWFFVFLLMGMLCFGSMIAALSSACQDLKDSQNFAGTVIMFLVIAMVLPLTMMEAPDGPLAVALSFIPPFSVMMMMLRISISPGPELWQIWVSLFLMLSFTSAVVFAASRIFRIGILAQGKTPTFKEIVRWIFRAS